MKNNKNITSPLNNIKIKFSVARKKKKRSNPPKNKFQIKTWEKKKIYIYIYIYKDFYLKLKANGIAFPLGRQTKPIFIIRKNSVYHPPDSSLHGQKIAKLIGWIEG